MCANDLRERIDLVHSRLISSSIVQSFDVLSEYVIEGIGIYRVRVRLVNGDGVELLERFELIAGKLSVGKYSFHWQHADGTLIRRWDNAPHHRQLASFPHHVHDGHEKNVLAHDSIDFFEVSWLPRSSVGASLRRSSVAVIQGRDAGASLAAFPRRSVGTTKTL